MTIRERMEALGWCACIDDDTCSQGWVKIRDGVAWAYGTDSEFSRDLDRCTREAEAELEPSRAQARDA